VGPAYASDPRIVILNADAFTYQPSQGQRYGMVWHDIWEGIEIANLEQMAMLRRRLDQIADWQGCSAEDLCVRWSAREAAKPGPYQVWARDQLLLYLTALVQVGRINGPLLRKYVPDRLWPRPKHMRCRTYMRLTARHGATAAHHEREPCSRPTYSRSLWFGSRPASTLTSPTGSASGRAPQVLP
jgi:hypothetical protein